MYMVELRLIVLRLLVEMAAGSEPQKLRFKKITEEAITPTRGSKNSAGYDLYSPKQYTVEPRGKVRINTEIAISPPEGCYCRVAPLSGLADKHFIDVGAGVIDPDYRGNVGVVLFNHSDKEFTAERGARIAQIICERIYCPDLEQVDSLDDTERGAGGFGVRQATE